MVTLATPSLPASSPAEKLTLAVVAGGLLALLLTLTDADPGSQRTCFTWPWAW